MKFSKFRVQPTRGSIWLTFFSAVTNVQSPWFNRAASSAVQPANARYMSFERLPRRLENLKLAEKFDSYVAVSTASDHEPRNALRHHSATGRSPAHRIGVDGPCW